MSTHEAPQPDPQRDALAQAAQFVDGVAQDLPEMGPAQHPLDSLQQHVDDPQVAMRAHLGAAADRMPQIFAAVQASHRETQQTRRRFAAIVGEPSLDPDGLRRERMRAHREEMVRRGVGRIATRPSGFLANARRRGMFRSGSAGNQTPPSAESE